MTDSNDIDNDPMFDVSEGAMLRARALQADLQTILVYEKERSHASTMIRKTWDKIKADGHNVAEARSKLVVLSITPRDS